VESQVSVTILNYKPTMIMTVLLDYSPYPNPDQNNRVLDTFLYLKSELSKIDNYYKELMRTTGAYITVIMSPERVLDMTITPSEGEVANEIRRFIIKELSIPEAVNKIMNTSQN
jgi:hypothetical protein